MADDTAEKVDNASAEKVLKACKDNYEKWKKDCSGYLKAVAADLEYTDLDRGDADAIVGYLASAANWLAVESGGQARDYARDGYFVLAGLKSGDHADKFKVTGKYLTALQGDGVPKDVSGKLTPLLSQKFLTPDQFAKKARSYLTPKEWDQYQDKVVSHAQAQGEFEVVKVANGHVAVVVDSTTLYHGKYPYVWGGSIGEAQSQGDKSVGEVWNTKDRDKVKIWRSKTPVP